MPRTVACIVVRTAKAFGWLGHMPIMNWSLDQLREVRGIDRIICCATRDLTSRSRKLFDKDDVELFTIPDKIPVDQPMSSEQAFDKWLSAANGPAADAEVLVIVKPTLPFLPAAKIEACIDPVRRKFASSCATVHEISTRSSTGKATAYIDVPGCRAFSPTRAHESKFRPVLVSLIESLDMADHDNHRIADALVASGAC